MRTILYCIALGLLMVGVAEAQCVAPAGCDAPSCGPKKVCGRCGTPCQVVCEMKKITKTVWVVECDEVCLPLPNCGGRGKVTCGECAEDACGGCAKQSCGGCRVCGGDPCAPLLARKVVLPKCGKSRPRKRLVKKEITCEVPVYKCVPGCGKGCGGCVEEIIEEGAPEETPATAVDVAPLPPPPALGT